jgi:hypothetical protein
MRLEFGVAPDAQDGRARSVEYRPCRQAFPVGLPVRAKSITVSASCVASNRSSEVQDRESMARLSNRYWISTPCPAPQPQLHGVGGAAGRLLLWSSLSFGLLAANNFIVVLDLILLPSIDLPLVRYALSLAAACLLLFGFIWDLED